MRILVNCANLISGGGVQVGLGFVDATLARPDGNEFYYILSRPIYNQLDREHIRKLRITVLDYSPGTLFGWIIANPVVIGICVKFKPDIIYSVGYPSYIISPYPEIGRYTNPWDFYPDPLPWHIFQNPVKRHLIRLSCVVRRLFAKTASHLETQTDFAKHCIMAKLNIPAESVTVIPNSISNEYYLLAKRERNVVEFCDFASGVVTVFCLAADHVHKNLGIVPEVCALLMQKYQQKVRFVLTVPENSRTWEKIHAQAKALGVGEFVLNVGVLNTNACIQWYQSSNLVFLPTLLEVFSATYLEAMAIGLPIVTSDRMFARDACGDAALYCDPCDPQDAARVIDELIRSPESYSRIAQAGLKQFSFYPNPAEKLTITYDMFDKVIHHKPERETAIDTNFMKYSKYQICSKTVMDTSDPSIRFDEDGISNHYWDFHNVVKLNWHVDATGRALLGETVEKIKRSGKGHDFDCIIGVSGGADSSYMLHSMVKEFGLRPLVFHVDGGWNSEVAVNNINVLIDKLGLDLFTEVINWEEMRDFQLAMFKSGVPHLDIPQDMSFIGVLYKFAKKHGIKYILNGGNISTECVAPPLEILYWGTDMVQIRDILRQHGTLPMRTYPFSSIWYHKGYLPLFRGIKVFKPLNYMPYKKNDAMDELERIYGWKPYPQKHFESRFTRFFEGYWLPTRFGYDMRRREFSSLILTGQMTRDEALSLLQQPPLPADIAEQEFHFVASKLGISADELQGYLTMPKKFYWDYRNQSRLFALGEWILTTFMSARRGGAY